MFDDEILIYGVARKLRGLLTHGMTDLGIKTSPMLLCHGSAKWVARFSKGPVPGYADCCTQIPTNANRARRPDHKRGINDVFVFKFLSNCVRIELVIIFF